MRINDKSNLKPTESPKIFFTCSDITHNKKMYISLLEQIGIYDQMKMSSFDTVYLDGLVKQSYTEYAHVWTS